MSLYEMHSVLARGRFQRSRSGSSVSAPGLKTTAIFLFDRGLAGFYLGRWSPVGFDASGGLTFGS